MKQFNILFNNMEYPRQLNVEGSKSVFCVGIKWSDQARYADEGDLRNMGNGVRSVYNRCSKGALDINIHCKVYRTEYRSHGRYLRKVENDILRKYPGADYYLIVNSISDGSHAGGRVAHLKSSLIRTACHELGHLLGLAHSGSYTRGRRYDSYGDGLSFMSKYSSSTLVAPQYYWMGWLKKAECYLYEGPSLQTFTLSILNRDLPEKQAVIINNKESRDVFISYQAGAICLHLCKEGGSSLIRRIGKEYFDERFTGLEIKKTGETENTVTFTVEILGDSMVDFEECELGEEESMSTSE